ncbi:unnamed protein product [Linum tenue]|uniref:Uncharacterized protein n=1 Tax=Linum tenue TaxID=586396 RepID=A0AAV0LTW1_9ROSI|nr:unnamed protein product [Linum tenue]
MQPHRSALLSSSENPPPSANSRPSAVHLLTECTTVS